MNISFDILKNKTYAVYGLGAETERFLSELRAKNGTEPVGLLDGYRESGTEFGCPVISMREAVKAGVKLILVIARPGSCKAIAKRIGDTCRENGVELVDIRGNDLLETKEASYGFGDMKRRSRAELMKEIEDADVISFDLFNTLITRETTEYTDKYELVGLKAKEFGISVPAFAAKRLAVEKKISKYESPVLKDIYKEFLKRFAPECDLPTNREIAQKIPSDCVSCSENEGSESVIKANKGGSAGSLYAISDIDHFAEILAQTEFDIDIKQLVPRKAVCDIALSAHNSGKTVILTSDTFFTEDQIRQIFEKCRVVGVDEIFASCECRLFKHQGLFTKVLKKYGDKKILHIGDDAYSDIESAEKHGIESFLICGVPELSDALGELGLEEKNDKTEKNGDSGTLADHIKRGLLRAHIFNDPFCIEENNGRLTVREPKDIGYYFCAPVILDFALWMKDRLAASNTEQVLFGARDGYLLQKVFELIDNDRKTQYFYTSRTAAIRAGVESEDDIEYVDAMKFFGDEREALQSRFGVDSREKVLAAAERKRENYTKYIDFLGVKQQRSSEEEDLPPVAFFDFVAKGTTQLFLEKIMGQKLQGLYFLQLEPEAMAKFHLDVTSFYTDHERDTSAIFGLYYILETILTAPHPQVLEFDAGGKPVFAAETRMQKDLKCVEEIQSGILSYVRDYLEIVPPEARTINKDLDEKLLSLITKIKIEIDDFLSLTVEDPFFNRMTALSDVLG